MARIIDYSQRIVGKTNRCAEIHRDDKQEKSALQEAEEGDSEITIRFATFEDIVNWQDAIYEDDK